MDTNIAIIITFLLLLVLLFSGIPIFAALALTGLAGTFFVEGFASIGKIGYLVWEGAYSWSLLCIPGFVLMGNLFFHHGFGAALFDAAYKWVGRLPGGLNVAATVMGALFGFISGSGLAGVTTIGSIAIPEVEKRNYDRKLSLGSFAIAGTLAVLIPPSLLMIVYGTMAEVSLGRLFFAGIIPGITLTILISLYIVLRCIINPSLGPPGPSFGWKERLRSVVGLIPVIITFLVVLGGIYMGVWSAIEAAAAGAIMAFIICVAYRRVTWSAMRASLYATVRICAMVYLIIMSAYLLNHFLFISGFRDFLVEFVTGLAAPNVVILVIVLFIMTIMGCFLDIMALLLISIPVFLPVILAVGYDPLWFGIAMIVECELAAVTPPVGVNLYVIKGLAPEGTKLSDVCLGVLPYVIVVWVLFALLIAFPALALWLPGTMMGR